VEWTGRRISHYLIEEQLGAGGMGVVYRAQDEVLQRTVAVKLLPADKAGDPERRERFLQEARAASALNHPGIVIIHEMGEQEGQAFIVMEYVEGLSLRQMLKSGPPDPQRMLPIATSAAEALAAAHARGLIHRDIKPDNIMVTADGRAKILDFGLAKLREPDGEMATQTAAIMGTPAYMAPEQLRGQTADARTDVYAFGLVLKEMGFAKVGAQASRQEPAERFQTMRDVLDALAPAPQVAAPRGLWTLVGLVAIAAIFGGLVLIREIRGRIGKPATKRQAIAVLYFRNLTQDPSLNWLDSGLTEMLTTNLSQLQGIDVLSTERVQSAVQRVGKGSSLNPGMAQEVAKQAGADLFVTGALIREGPTRLRLDVKLQDSAAGQIVAAEKLDGDDVQAVFGMVDALTHRLAQRFAPAAASGARGPAIEETTTANVEAYRHYQAGLDYWRRFLYREAKTEFEEALRQDPEFVAARWRLSQVYAPLGDLRTAEELMGQVEQKAARLPRKDQLMVKARRASLSGDREGEQNALHALIREFPRESEVRMYLSTVCRNNDQLDRSIDVLKEGLALDPRDDAQWNAYSYALGLAGNVTGALEANDRYQALLPANPNPLDSRGDVLFVAGRSEEAITFYRKVLEMKPDFNSGYAAFKIALASADLGRSREAEEASRLFTQLSSQAQLRLPLLQAQLESQRGDLAAASRSYRRAVEGLAKAGQTVSARDALLVLAQIATVIGDVKNALAFARQQKLLGEELMPIATLEIAAGNAAAADAALARYAEIRPQVTKQAVADFLARARLTVAVLNNDVAGAKAEAARLTHRGQNALAEGWILLQDKDFTRAEERLRLATRQERSKLSGSGSIITRSPLAEQFAHYLLGQVYEGSGRRDQAAAEYQGFLKFYGKGKPLLYQAVKAREALKRLGS